MTRPRSKLGGMLLATTIAAGVLPTQLTAQSAGQVLLDAADGSIDVTGTLVAFSDEFYTLQTSLGIMRISAERVRCIGSDCPVFETADADIRIAGSGALGVGLMPLLLDGFSSEMEAEASISTTNTPGEVIATMIGDDGFGDEIGSYLVTPSSTGQGFENLLATNAQITMASRRILPTEARALKKAGAGNMVSPSQEHIVAVDSIAVVTHRDNPITSLTMEQVASIYDGRVTNWRQLGGPDLAITPVGHEDGSDIRDVFETRIFGEDVSGSSNSALIGADHNEVASFVNENPGAIGYVGYAFLRGTKPISLINECNIAMIPDTFSSKTEEYSLQRRMYLYTRADVQDEAVSNFLSYAVSENADDVILKSGFIDLGVELREQTMDSERAQLLIEADYDDYERGIANEMLSWMAQYDRLSTTFRFRTGSSRLDERGRLDMERLTRYLSNRNDQTELLLVGFTDDVGPFSPNLNISKKRANEMVGQLKEALDGKIDNVTIRSTGFGELAPSACNVTDPGRSINRRVEVWIKRSA